MKINLSGHHVDVTDTVKEHVSDKFSKIGKHFPSLIALDVTISKEHNEFQVELRTHYEGSSLAASGANAVMYPAIAEAADKLNAALKHRKGQLKADRHQKPTCTTPEIAHEIIQDMKLV
ncbi:ribosome-associated translation inhibitor RaiA [Parashewanella spongiae]|uniref:Ribosome hibernation promoting factor n=1 Tax=Parashewanella spongiae TaxID=342950 RepID=A0A3A6TIL6_9GAMM|nr:ribosome-associated translation inhibitor RaiA [Parashewanella spongiae]MCL1077072.1 ribosome-associated translation inhibitor RaiA [Parashewanella spongiae]RJY10455.1 ribosome-associated translation inhibitor RaiA [Parashewanella spongiae]